MKGRLARGPVSLVSLMAPSPGQRQFASLEKYREYYQGKYSLNDVEMARYEEEQLALAAQWSQPNRVSIAAMCRDRNIALASHDDATHDVGREDIQQAERGELACRHVAGMRAAAHDVRSPHQHNRFTLPQAIRLVTRNPASALNLHDRGEIAEGKRADLVLAHRKGEHIHIDHVWRQGAGCPSRSRRAPLTR